jgi:hypothetical protein
MLLDHIFEVADREFEEECGPHDPKPQVRHWVLEVRLHLSGDYPNHREQLIDVFSDLPARFGQFPRVREMRPCFTDTFSDEPKVVQILRPIRIARPATKVGSSFEQRELSFGIAQHVV